MKKRTAEKPGSTAPTDAQFMEAYHRLPVSRQRAYLHEVVQESRNLQRVISFETVLSDPVVLAEARRLARAAGLALREFGTAINPFRYSSYFARSPRCTLGKLTSVDYGRTADVAETIVLVKAYAPVEFLHTIIPCDFDLHVLKGTLEIRLGGTLTSLERSAVATIEARENVSIRMRAGCWVAYKEHPLTTWIGAHARDESRS